MEDSDIARTAALFKIVEQCAAHSGKFSHINNAAMKSLQEYNEHLRQEALYRRKEAEEEAQAEAARKVKEAEVPLPNQVEEEPESGDDTSTTIDSVRRI